MDKAFNFTKGSIERIPTPEKRTEYRDAGGPQSVPGLTLVVSNTGRKVFNYRRKLYGKSVRVRLGDYPSISVHNARCEAQKTATEILVNKVNPNNTKRDKRSSELTFGEVFEDYLSYSRNRAKPLRETTVANYRRSFEQHFGNGEDSKGTSPIWTDKPMSRITPAGAIAWYTKAKAVSPSSANSALRVARAVWNHAIKRIRKADHSRLFLFNPFDDVDQVRDNVRVARIQSDDLPAWFDAVATLRNSVVRDYLVFLLLTGLRLKEASKLNWSEVNLKERTLTIPGERTKSGKTLTLPLSDYMLSILGRRKEQHPDSQWVFPSSRKDSRSGYISNPKTAVKLVCERSGIKFSPHALRRTFANLGIDSARVTEIQIKRLLNHSNSSDVTMKHYLNAGDIEDLRADMQRITDAILKIGKQQQAQIIRLRADR